MGYKIKTKAHIEFSVTLDLTEVEARALCEMVKYGSKAFLEGYYKQLGKSYMKPYEEGVHSLFETIKKELQPKVNVIDESIEILSKNLKKEI
jgi:hypothetical protein